MNTWVVGNHPIGHHVHNYPSKRLAEPGQTPQGIITTLTGNRLVPTSLKSRNGEEGTQREEFGEKVFFMKARIMAGQADLSKNEFGDSEFRWLTKEEVRGVVTKGYWSSVANMLAQR
jgi:large subunit ribosomal protein L46